MDRRGIFRGRFLSIFQIFRTTGSKVMGEKVAFSYLIQQLFTVLTDDANSTVFPYSKKKVSN